MQNRYDLIVVGGGPGGYVGAIRAAQLGMRVALVERNQIGGTCLNRGCIPTKTLLHSALRYREMTQCKDFGIEVQSIQVDSNAVFNNVGETVDKLREGVTSLLKANKVELIGGNATIDHERTVKVNGERLQSEYLLLAPGSRPIDLRVEGGQLPGVLNSDQWLEGAGQDSQSVVIVGGGVIGMEFATLLNAFGKTVTVVEVAERILPNLDREISQNLSMILKRRGVTLLTGVRVQEITREDDLLWCRFAQENLSDKVGAQAVLSAVGRRANIGGLFEEGVSINTDNTGIAVNDNFETNIPGVFAVGDAIAGSVQLAHAASAQALCAVAHMAGISEKPDLSAIPSCIYTDPEIAVVGIAADEAKHQNIPVRVGKYTMSGNSRSVVEHQERGFVKLVFEADGERLIGAQLMCARATDMIAELASAMTNKLTARQLSAVVRPHPSFVEGIGEAVESVWGQAIHIAPRK